MEKMLFVIICLVGVSYTAMAQEQGISVHDPVMIPQDGIYYIFCTGNGLSLFLSTDMVNWKRENPVFTAAPAWVIKELPRFRNSMWAPDISFYKGYYYPVSYTHLRAHETRHDLV